MEWGILSVVWFLLAAGTIAYRRRLGLPGTGLLLSYFGLFGVYHVLPALLNLVPSYSPNKDVSLSFTGFQESIIATIAFSVGCVSVEPALFRRYIVHRKQNTSEGTVGPSVNRVLPAVYLTVGLLSYIVFARISAGVPTLSAFMSNLSYLMLGGLILGSWNAIRTRGKWGIAIRVMLAMGFPFVTVAVEGFIGIGATFLLIFLFAFLSFSNAFFRWIPLALVVVYFGLSVFVTYSIQRNTIRSIVWADGVTLDDRLAVLQNGIDGFELFDVNNPEHLSRIEVHTDQNLVAGRAITRISNGYVDYAWGATLWDALLMLVPRALWPDKPIKLGGSALVAQFTGVSTYGGTSVGLGQVAESYVNFGTIGVVAGFLLLGLLVSFLDDCAERTLRSGRWLEFPLWYVPALSVLQVGNNLLAVTGAGVSGLLAVFLLNRFVIPAVASRYTHSVRSSTMGTAFSAAPRAAAREDP